MAIAAGGNHSLALKADSTLVAWGNNTSGQTNIPASATNIVAISASGDYSLALRSDGVVLGWGENGYGQTSVPPSANNIVAIAAGSGLFQFALTTADGWNFSVLASTNLTAPIAD